jgi:hypothetical protein
MSHSHWQQRVLRNPLPVMVHVWSETLAPERSEKLAPIIDDVAIEFAGKMEAVRTLGVSMMLCGIAPSSSVTLCQQYRSLLHVQSKSWPTTATFAFAVYLGFRQKSRRHAVQELHLSSGCALLQGVLLHVPPGSLTSTFPDHLLCS